MGRDFTPQDFHKADMMFGFSKNRTVITDVHTNERVVLYDPECNKAKRWPNAYFLGDWIVDHLVDVPSVLDRFENVLKEIIERDDQKKIILLKEDYLYNTVLRWYKGKLDPHFYYNETNNRLMEEALRKEAEKEGENHEAD